MSNRLDFRRRSGKLNLELGKIVGKANILIVDDHAENLLALEAMLEDLGENLVRASSGEEALLRVLDMDFAVILLDVQMPSMDGFEVASMIRQRDRSKNTPIIFLTAIHRLEENVLRGYHVGAVDYLFKPLIPEILCSKVDMFVKMWRQTWEIKVQAEYLDKAHTDKERQLRELKRLNRELEVLNKELEAFSYSASHDLRAPLRRISGYSEALMEDYHDKLDSEGQEYLQRICAMCDHMGQLIDDMLTLSRVTRAKLDLKVVNLSTIATQITNQLRATTPERNCEFIICSGLYVSGDERLLTILLENLLGNAWKFTRKHASACIEFGALAQEGKQPVFYIRDDGAGFDMQYAQKLFGAFQRLHTDNEFEGNGIGLATSQRVINRHGGKIWAESKPEQGATFYFTL
jgi:two-component system, sensor histidine kinase and response regulator